MLRGEWDLRFFLCIILCFVSTVSFAKIHCVCDIGKDSFEEPIYKIGCKMWHDRQQQCDTKITKQIDSNNKYLIDVLPDIKDGDVIRAGYVGHWVSTSQTLLYVYRHLYPIATTKKVKIVYENTACNPVESPFYLQENLRDLNLLEGSSIMVKGSQALSIGMWDELYLGQANFYAYASTEWVSPGFVLCKKIEHKKCIGNYQENETGLCFDRRTKDTVKLTCREVRTLGDNTREYEWVRW